MRISLAPCLTTQCERSIKLLQASHTGLTDGLEPIGDDLGHGLSEIAWPLQAMSSEARLFIQPVSAEIGSSSQAEGIEDRMTMAGLSARKLKEMCDLGIRCCSISIVISCQAIDLRYGIPIDTSTERRIDTESACYHLGDALAAVHRRVRTFIPFMNPGDPPPGNLDRILHDILLF